MVLEALISPLTAEKRPWQLFFLGLFFTAVAMFLSYWIFKEQASIVMVFFVVLASVPIVYNIIKFEEAKDEEMNVGEFHLLKEHAKALSVFMFLFLGILVLCALVYVFMPQNIISSLFGIQISTIDNINHHVSGNVVTPGVFSIIFFNNLKVLIFCILFAFVYGVGALFILTWNASVIGVALGEFVRLRISEVGTSLGFFGVSHYFAAFSLGLLRYMTHGVFEILAYFIAGLAGGIISICVVRNHVTTKKFHRAVFDSFGLLLLSIVFLLIGSLVEVFVTPLFF